MENFIVSARKYRPATFDTVVGQLTITNTLKNAISSNHLAQAYLFTGPRGVGKTTTARIFAKTINCMNIDPTKDPSNIEPCNVCESCKSFSTNSSFNIYELDAASNNSVDDIRQLVDQVRIPPQVGKYKIYIIDEVHMLSTQAFNAFLKTLEEPPTYVKFILATTERHKIIPTILSRCQVFNFSRITIKDMAQHLRYVANSENVKADDDALHLIAEKADGALRDALSIFDQLVSFTSSDLSYQKVVDNLHILDHDYFFKISHHISKGEISSVLMLLNDILERGFDGQHFIIGFGEHLRNLMISQDLQTINLMDTSENIKEKYRQDSSNYNTAFLLKALDLNNQCDIHYRTSNNKRLLIELALMKMCGIANGYFQEEGAEKKRIDLKKNDVPVSLISEHHIITKKEAISEIIQKPILVPKPQAETIVETPKSVPLYNSETPIQKEEKISPSPIISTAKPLEETKTTPTPSKIKKGFTSGIGFGFNLNEDKNEQNEEEDLTAYMVGKENIADEINTSQLNEILDDFIDSLDNQPSLQSVLKAEKPELINQNDIEFKVYNESQSRDLKEHSELLLMKLRTQLNNYQIKIKTTILASQNYKAKDPNDKFEKMAQQNPNLRKLKDQLNLKIEF